MGSKDIITHCGTTEHCRFRQQVLSVLKGIICPHINADKEQRILAENHHLTEVSSPEDSRKK
jgi:hypothetical protein